LLSKRNVRPLSAGIDNGGAAAPNKSAASEGVDAVAMPARAAAIAFIDSFPIEAGSPGATRRSA
jgi:hypothetical protein